MAVFDSFKLTQIGDQKSFKKKKKKKKRTACGGKYMWTKKQQQCKKLIHFPNETVLLT